MSLVTADPLADIKSEGTVFGATEGPRVLGDVLTEGVDLVPLFKGGVMTTAVVDEPAGP